MPDMTNEKLYYIRKYWDLMCSLHAQICYLEYYRQLDNKFDKSFSIFTAIFSGASVAGWGVSNFAIWLKTSILCAVCIAISHIIDVVRRHFPYQKRLKFTNELRYSLSRLLIRAKRDWYDVANGKLDGKRIHDLCIDIEEERIHLEEKHIAYDLLPLKKVLKSKAELETKEYFTNF